MNVGCSENPRWVRYPPSIANNEPILWVIEREISLGDCGMMRHLPSNLLHLGPRTGRKESTIVGIPHQRDIRIITAERDAARERERGRDGKHKNEALLRDLPRAQ
jgi:hypothetical protein